MICANRSGMLSTGTRNRDWIVLLVFQSAKFETTRRIQTTHRSSPRTNRSEQTSRYLRTSSAQLISVTLETYLNGSSILPIVSYEYAWKRTSPLFFFLFDCFHQAEMRRTKHLPYLFNASSFWSTFVDPEICMNSSLIVLKRRTLTNDLIRFSGWSDISATTTSSERSDSQRTTAYSHCSSSNDNDDDVSLGIRGKSSSTEQNRTTWGHLSE